MTVALTGAGGLFTRLGKVAKKIRLINTHQDTRIDDDTEAIIAQYDTLRLPVSGLYATIDTERSQAGAINSTLQQVARDTVLQMVAADNPQLSNSDLGTALTELIRQMKAAAASVTACTVAASAAAIATPAMAGDGAIVLSTKRGDGLVEENLFAEVAPITCQADSQSGSATAASEPFAFKGDYTRSDVWACDWPKGSGGSSSLVAIDPAIDAGSQNLLTNGDMETFTVANTPDNWTIVVGTPGVGIFKDVGVFYDGLASLKFVGAATLYSITQTFNLSAGTLGKVKPLSAYAVNFWTKVDVVPAAGVLTVDLIDGAGTTINDDAGVANSFTVALTGLTTSFAAKNGVFRLPRVLPSAVKLRLRVSTALSAGSNLYIDRIGFGEMTQLYPGGPRAAVFSGATAFVKGDGWNITTTNDRAAATYNSTFQTFFDRAFGMRGLGLLLPSSGAPTILDTLITA